MSAKIDFGSDETFIKNYQKLKSSRKMGELYGCNKTSILNHAKKIGFDPKILQSGKLSEKDKKEIIEAYDTDITSTQLAEKYGVSRGMITKLWYDANLKGKKHTNIKYNLAGQKINNLTVISKTDNRDAAGSIKWLCECDCGNLVEVSSTRLISGEVKSCGCLSKKALKIGQGLNFKDLTGQTFGKLTVLERCEDKIYSDRKFVQWLCKCECGKLTKVTGNNLKNGDTQSCGLCENNSHGNIKIETILKENNIAYEREKRFSSCKDINILPFDFYINNQYLIEYDGKQHFQETNTIFNYENTHKHDLIKSKWCKENNIPLIRIPYTHYNDLKLKDLLLETSSFVEK